MNTLSGGTLHSSNRARWNIRTNRLRIAALQALMTLAMSFAFAIPAQAAPVFTVAKNLCTGVPLPASNAANCPLAPIVPMGALAYYTITLVNPPAQPAQSITLTDAFPGFTVSPGTFCENLAGAPISLLLPSSGIVGTIALAAGDTVTCFVPGSFAAVAAAQTNIVTAKNTENLTLTSAVTTQVALPAPLSNDIVVEKVVSPSNINVAGGPQFVNYKITITNNGPAVSIGHWFVLHDNLRLLPNSVALLATLVSANCTPSVSSTGCLDLSAAPFGVQKIVGTMAPHPFFDLGWDNATPDNFDANETITLDFVVKFEEIPTLECYQVLNADGVLNEAFFTLTNVDGTAKTESNPANNTDSVPISVLTGNLIPDLDCTFGQLTVTKKQLFPANPVSWTSPSVIYDITIKNTSFPPQPITITGGNFEDLVQEGPNTPPFTRTQLGTASCVPGIANTAPPTLCPPFLSGGGVSAPHSYTYYGETNQGWRTSNANNITLGGGHKITVRLRFRYFNPDCDTVPNANPKLIRNWAHVTYTAGLLGTLTPPVVQDTWAKVDTLMQPQPPCKFVVTKRLISGGPPLKFGVPLQYEVTFTNNGNQRDIKTVMDAVRITNPAYGTPLPFSGKWICTETGGVSNVNLSPQAFSGGSAVFTSTPAHGSVILNPRLILSAPMNFPTGASVKCIVEVTVQRPAYNNPNCTAAPAQFENMGLMDVTEPFNPNPAWPPSGLYPGGPSNPLVQDKNWATVRTRLPRCYDATINKSASVQGLPPFAGPWTYPGGPAVDYTISITNTAQSALTGSGAWNGLMAYDEFSPPIYNLGSSIQQVPPACSPGVPIASPPWCQLSPFPLDPKRRLGVRNLGAGLTGLWNLKNTGPFIANTTIKNCADLYPKGSLASSGNWYANYQIMPPLGTPGTDSALLAAMPLGPQKKCVDVPVVNVADLKVIKQVVDEIGLGTAAAGPFPMQVSCTPYQLPTASSQFSISTGSSGTNSHGVQHVPVADTCVVTEPASSLPPVPTEAGIKCGGAAEWAVSIQPASIVIAPTNNVVTVTNTLRCVPQPEPVKLEIFKVVVNNTGIILPNPPVQFTVNANCSVASMPPSVTIADGGVDAVSTLSGTTCSPTEVPPVTNFCIGQQMVDNWVTQFSPSGPIPITAPGPVQVTVTNTLTCVPQT